MPNLLIRDMPADLHNWLREQAVANHRSANRQAITLLESVRHAPQPSVAPSTRTADPKELARMRAKLAEFHKKMATFPTANDHLTDDEILGYDENGLPT